MSEKRRCRDCGATSGSTTCDVTGFACVMVFANPHDPPVRLRPAGESVGNMNSQGPLVDSPTPHDPPVQTVVEAKEHLWEQINNRDDELRAWGTAVSGAINRGIEALIAAAERRGRAEVQQEIKRLTAEYHELQLGAVAMNGEAIRERLRADAAEADVTRLKTERDDAIKVLAPNMPESGLVDACRQIKQVAISEADNATQLEKEVTRLSSLLAQRDEALKELRADRLKLRMH